MGIQRGGRTREYSSRGKVRAADRAAAAAAAANAASDTDSESDDGIIIPEDGEERLREILDRLLEYFENLSQEIAMGIDRMDLIGHRPFPAQRMEQRSTRRRRHRRVGSRGHAQPGSSLRPFPPPGRST